jgi:hypothetical protein
MSGWIWLAITLGVGLEYASHFRRRAMGFDESLGLAIMIAWTLWLVSP